jgi:hypothetical protein
MLSRRFGMQCIRFCNFFSNIHPDENFRSAASETHLIAPRTDHKLVTARLARWQKLIHNNHIHGSSECSYPVCSFFLNLPPDTNIRPAASEAHLRAPSTDLRLVTARLARGNYQSMIIIIAAVQDAVYPARKSFSGTPRALGTDVLQCVGGVVSQPSSVYSELSSFTSKILVP